MGSFLMSCGISGNTLREGMNTRTMFVNRQVGDRDGKFENMRGMRDWYVEDIIIAGTMADCGAVEADEVHHSDLLEVMRIAAKTCIDDEEDRRNWKKYYSENMAGRDEAALLKNFNEYFKQFQYTLQSGIIYRSPVQGTINVMGLCHIDEVAFDVALDSPAWSDNLYLEYINDEERIGHLLMNFEDYVKFLFLKNVERLDSGYDIFVGYGEPNYHRMLNTVKPRLSLGFDQEEFTVDYLNDVLTKHYTVQLIVSYLEMLGLNPKPSAYVGQDYPSYYGRNHRNALSAIFEAQRQAFIAHEVENASMNGEDFYGNDLPIDWNDDDADEQVAKLNANAIDALKGVNADMTHTYEDLAVRPTALNYHMLEKFVL